MFSSCMVENRICSLWAFSIPSFSHMLRVMLLALDVWTFLHWLSPKCGAEGVAGTALIVDGQRPAHPWLSLVFGTLEGPFFFSLFNGFLTCNCLQLLSTILPSKFCWWWWSHMVIWSLNGKNSMKIKHGCMHEPDNEELSWLFQRFLAGMGDGGYLYTF